MPRTETNILLASGSQDLQAIAFAAQDDARAALAVAQENAYEYSHNAQLRQLATEAQIAAERARLLYNDTSSPIEERVTAIVISANQALNAAGMEPIQFAPAAEPEMDWGEWVAPVLIGVITGVLVGKVSHWFR